MYYRNLSERKIVLSSVVIATIIVSIIIIINNGTYGQGADNHDSSVYP